MGGKDHIINISYVDWKSHQNWDLLFGNMNALQTCDLINNEFTPDGVRLICKFINGDEVKLKGGKESKNPKKRKLAWEAFTHNLSFEETIHYINNTWLDPSYHFYLENI